MTYILNSHTYSNNMHIDITLAGIGQPQIRWADGTVHTLPGAKTFTFHDQYEIKFEYFGKTYDQEQYINIVKLSVMDMESPKITLQSQYKPDYPEPWYSQQSPVPDNILYGYNHLGWNGTWSLTTTAPIFTWLHKTLELGWIY